MISDERTLEGMLSEPGESTCRVLAETKGDFLVLGAGGKMGPTLAMMLRKAAPGRKVLAVSRYSDRDVKARIEDRGIETIEADLLDESIYADLPDAPNVFFLAGMKFGATGNQPLTWAMNVYVPALVARRYARSRIVALSTGNVYPFTDTGATGSRETDVPSPVGEYAQSCLCLLYTSDAADDLLCVDLGGRRIIKKKNIIRQYFFILHSLQLPITS